MPLYKKYAINAFTEVLIWNITESFDDLFDEVYLKDISLIRLNNMKALSHQKGFLSVRKLLQEAGYSDEDLFYDETGKPNLKDQKTISITHSFDFSAIIISDRATGIDLEMQREKIIAISEKFMDTEFDFLPEKQEIDFIQKSTVIWGAKEAIFKIENKPGISFKDHISVFPFEIKESKTNAILTFESQVKEFNIQFELVENYVLVVAFEKY
ncbi:4-phosphopantetheinyl transferase [Flavobacterium sp.]|uniref:4'-phosphopantetheinyl transferase family protein n=1 Tax=Flavobacterium sp. TaxID=239 RepID=UPI00261351B8|nr:4-phosphopantetheinyl transferase [Flavobacterium sp.]MDD3003315.1 4-phosphopantetheinyl transferase [Flavobacterium sp.]